MASEQGTGKQPATGNRQTGNGNGNRQQATGRRWAVAVGGVGRDVHCGMDLRDEYNLPPDPVIEYYKKDVDRTLLREHLKLTPQQRLERLVAHMRALDALRAARRDVR